MLVNSVGRFLSPAGKRQDPIFLYFSVMHYQRHWVVNEEGIRLVSTLYVPSTVLYIKVLTSSYHSYHECIEILSVLARKSAVPRGVYVCSHTPLFIESAVLHQAGAYVVLVSLLIYSLFGYYIQLDVSFGYIKQLSLQGFNLVLGAPFGDLWTLIDRIDKLLSETAIF